MKDSNIIELKTLSFEFADTDTRVLEKIDLKVKPHEFISIIGPSGCGKTTVLKLLSDLIDVDGNKLSGKIKIFNSDPKNARQRNMIGFAFQDAVLLPWRNVKDNLNLPSELINKSNSDFWDADDLLNKLGLLDFKDAYPNELSGGMKQRLAIARTLIFQPSILLMDEPFGSLDASTREELNIELLKIWRLTNATVIFVTHSISEAIFLSDRVITLTKRPAQILHELKIDLDRPRDIKIKESIEFINYSKILRAELEKART